jgi:hypothetical protein
MRARAAGKENQCWRLAAFRHGLLWLFFVLCLFVLRLQKLRGKRLDHEHHDMSEQHEPAGAAMYPAIPCLAGDIAPFDDAQGRLRQGGTCSMLPQANLVSIS